MKFLKVALLLGVASTLAATAASAQINAGAQKPEASNPFTLTQVASFGFPWRLAFLPDGRMIVTEKTGPIWLVNDKGVKQAVTGAPHVVYGGQGGMLGVFLSPHFATDNSVYLTYSEPGAYGSGLALAKATLKLTPAGGSLNDLKVIWHQTPTGMGGQLGAQVAFAPDGQSLFLTVGDRQRFEGVQDPSQPIGKILHLTLDGKPAADNPQAGKTGSQTITLIDPPKNTEAAKTAPVVSSYTFPGQNLTPSETWSVGHRTPYGLAFGPDGKLWEAEHGPRGGDELNLIEKGKNYGWPLTSYSTNYDGVPIASPDTRKDLVKPVIYWTPIIAPGNITFYKGAMFPQWNGSILMGGMATKSLNRIVVDAKGGAKPAERWDVGHRIRDVEVAPDGSLWLLEDDASGGLFHVTPK